MATNKRDYQPLTPLKLLNKQRRDLEVALVNKGLSLEHRRLSLEFYDLQVTEDSIYEYINTPYKVILQCIISGDRIPKTLDK